MSDPGAWTLPCGQGAGSWEGTPDLDGSAGISWEQFLTEACISREPSGLAGGREKEHVDSPWVEESLSSLFRS
jgi:hypothetical protein